MKYVSLVEMTPIGPFLIYTALGYIFDRWGLVSNSAVTHKARWSLSSLVGAGRGGHDLGRIAPWVIFYFMARGLRVI